MHYCSLIIRSFNDAIAMAAIHQMPLEFHQEKDLEGDCRDIFQGIRLETMRKMTNTFS
jgi:hypothetical protein